MLTGKFSLSPFCTCRPSEACPYPVPALKAIRAICTNIANPLDCFLVICQCPLFRSQDFTCLILTSFAIKLFMSPFLPQLAVCPEYGCQAGAQREDTVFHHSYLQFLFYGMRGVSCVFPTDRLRLFSLAMLIIKRFKSRGLDM